MIFLLAIALALQLLKILLRAKTVTFASRRGKRTVFCLVSVSEVLLIMLSGRYSVLFPIERAFIGFGIGAILGAGFLVFALYITKFSARTAAQQIRSLQNVPSYIITKKYNALHHLILVVKEELFWRASIQYLLGNTYLSVSVTALWFTAIHFDLENKAIAIMDYLELFLFSLALGFLFYIFDNIYVVTAVHFVRNIGILCIRQTVRQ